MHPIPLITRRRSVRPRMLLTAIVTAVCGLVAALVPFAAASAQPPAASFTLAIDPVTPTVLAGEDMAWRISWQCSSVVVDCTGATVHLPLPASAPDGITVDVGASSVSPSSGGYSTAQSITATEATWTMVDPLPAGSSGQMFVALRSRNLVTPSGSTYTPTATISGTNADPVSEISAPVTVLATIDLTLTKTRLGTIEPSVDTDVVYRVSLHNTNYPFGANVPVGSGGVQNPVIVDTLPPGSAFVDATNGGVYDPGTHTVTWTIPSSGPNYDDHWADQPSVNQIFTAYITITYPSPPFVGDGDLATTTDEVTNSADVTAQPYLRPADPPVTRHAQASHGFQAVDTGGPGLYVAKAGWYEYTAGSVVRRGESTGHWFVDLVNTGSTAVGYEIDDNLPCAWVSPAAPAVGCAAPDLATTSLRTETPIISAMTFDWASVNGATGTLVVPAGTPAYTPLSFGLASGDAIASLHVSGSLPVGVNQRYGLYGTVRSDLPQDDPTGVTYQRSGYPIASNIDVEIENCLVNVNMVTGAGSTPLGFDPALRCGHVHVTPDAPLSYLFKTATNSVQAPGGDVTFVVQGTNVGSLAAPVTFADLLPANLTLVPGSLVIDPGGTNWSAATTAVEVIGDYHGTGRQMLRVASIVPIPPGGGYFGFHFQARVDASSAPGTYPNTARQFFGGISDSAALAARTCVYGTVADTDDWDDDGSTTDRPCLASANYTVTPTGAVRVTKSVRGSFDGAFVSTPGIGTTAPGSDAWYRIDISNVGYVDLQQIVLYDVLPQPGDIGVRVTSPRDSAWTAALRGAPTLPAGVTVEYSSSQNPCRGEVMTTGGTLASGPAGCVNDWTASLTDPSTVRSMRFTVAGSLAPTSSLSIDVPVSAPADAAGIAWNTAAIAAQRADDATWLLPAESPKVGLQIPVDLSLEKTADPTDLHVGDLATYTITVRNDGPSDATGVVVSDPVPAAVALVDSSTSQGTFDADASTWTVGSLPAGATATLSLRVRATQVGAVDNTAQISDADQPDIDSTPGNGDTTHEDDDDTATIRVTAPPTSTTTTVAAPATTTSPGPTTPGAGASNGALDQTTTTGDPSTPATTSASTTGGLAFTGSSVALLSLIGALALALGALVVWADRRRANSRHTA